MWLLPLLIVGTTVVLSVPIGFYLAWIADGRYRPPKWLHWVEQRLDTGPQNWKLYSVSMLLFNTVMFLFGYVVLALQPLLPLNPDPAPYSVQWDIATGLVMLFGRFLPIIAPIAFAASLGAKKPTPFTVGTLRTDTITFGIFLLGTILLVGALLFMPAAMLAPVAEHLGPIPFGG